MQSVSTFFKEERDFLYKKGLEKGEKRGEKKDLEKAQAKALEERKISARILKQKGIDIGLIAKSLKLPKEVIEAL